MIRYILKNLKSVIVILFMLFTGHILLYSQPPHLQFNYLTTDEGLSSSTVTYILQDSYGLMWIATYDGLDMYDGQQFKVYKNIPGDVHSISNSLVRCIFEDRDTNLWIGTSSGLSLYNREKDNFINYMDDSTSALYNRYGTITTITEDSANNLWMATYIGLIRFNPANNTSTVYTHNKNDPGSISNDILESVFIDSKNRMWISSRKGLNLYLPKTKTFAHITSGSKPDEDFSDVYFQGIDEDKNGDLWFGSTSGLYRIHDFRQAEQAHLIHYISNSNHKHSLLHNHAQCIFNDHRGNLWIGIENGGLDLYNEKKDNFWHYGYDPYNMKSLDNESIYSIAEDNSGNLWVGTFAGGINVSVANGDAILLYKNLPGAPEGLSYNSVLCFLQDHNENIWVGTDGGGLNRFYPENGRFIHFNTENSGISSDAIISIQEDHNHKIWLGTWAGGLVHFDPKDNSFISFTTRNSKIPDNNIYTIAVGNKDDLWLGSFQNGLIHFDEKSREFTSYTMSNSPVLNNYITVIKKDRKGNFYLGSTNGFQIFSPNKATFVTYQNKPGNDNSLSSSYINDILIENDSSVWIGTNNGLNHFNPVTLNFVRYNIDDGLPNNVIKGIVADNSGTLWVTTNEGVCHFDYINKKYRNFTRADGLQGKEFNAKSVLKTTDDDLLLGGTKGFNVINPEKIRKNNNIPKILITQMDLFNKPVTLYGDKSPLKKQIYLTKKIVLHYYQNVLTLHFAAMDYTAPGRNQYAYKLENFDKNWIQAGNKHEATYTNLDPGNYTFRVIGSNNDGVWNKKGAELRIQMLPPWWKTIWFRLLIIILIIALAISFFLYRVKDLKKQKANLEKEVVNRTRVISEKNQMLSKQTDQLNEVNILLEERQQQIEEQAEELKVKAEELILMNEELTKSNVTKDKFFSIIAHDLKNPFNTIIGFIDLLSVNFNKWPEEKTKSIIGHVGKATNTAYELLDNLLTWSRAQRGVLPFKTVKINIGEIVEKTINLVHDSARRKDIFIEVRIDPKDLTVEADYNMLYTILRNLITNAIKFTRKNGKLIINARQENKFVLISVADNGVGMDQQTLESLFRINVQRSQTGTDNEPGTGLGLILCKEFIDKHLGEIFVESELGNGSTFTVKLPVKSKV